MGGRAFEYVGNVPHFVFCVGVRGKWFASIINRSLDLELTSWRYLTNFPVGVSVSTSVRLSLLREPEDVGRRDEVSGLPHRELLLKVDNAQLGLAQEAKGLEQAGGDNICR